MIEEILTQMADQIRSAISTDDFPIQVEPGYILKPNTPTVDMFPGPVARGTEAAGFGDIAGELLITLRARVQPNDYDANQSLLYQFADETSDLSLLMALFEDQTLGGYAVSIDIRSTSGFQLYPLVDGSAFHLGFEYGLFVTPAFS